MKILIITPKIPYPPVDGHRISMFGVIKYLKKRNHEIDVIAYRQGEERSRSEGLNEYARLFALEVSTENTLSGMIKNLFSAVPYNLWKYKHRELTDFLIEYFSENNPDIIQVTNAHMGWTIYQIRKLNSSPVILKEENLELLIMKRFYMTQRDIFIKFYSFMQYKKFTRYEPDLCSKFDKCIFVSGQDAKAVKEMNPKVEAVAIPVGVESELLKMSHNKKEPYSLFHIGSLNWFPNYDGISWFLEEIFPDVVKSFPEVRLYLYGGGIPNGFVIDQSIKSNVVIMGFVDNIWQSINDKFLAIVPLRIGGGIRVKILELMAAGHNIISTSLGAEGIPVEDGKDILIADSASEFLGKIKECFTGKYKLELMSENARKLISKNYTWETVAEMYEQEYKRLTDKN